VAAHSGGSGYDRVLLCKLLARLNLQEKARK
jgi:hypothetical protein